MATKPNYKLEALLKVLATKPMNSAEIKRWLSSRSGGRNTFPWEQDRWNYSLYGTRRQVGVLERFCRKNKDGRYQTVRKVEAPFTPKRYGINDLPSEAQIQREQRLYY
jgi:hypothetical protein